jgi:nucleoside-diphosphate kinase
VRVYNLTYYTKDSTIDMVHYFITKFDLKNKRIFLKRCEYPTLNLEDIFVGATLNIYSRQLKVVDYADQFTRGKFDKHKGKYM